MSALFIADLHLDAARPATLKTALALFDDAADFEQLWILGDLFEAWIGDDAATDDPVAGAVCTALASLGARGTSVHLMHGNRDFLLGEDFATRCGATLHRQDEISIEASGRQLLLLHGDTLCTEDVDYQSLRTTLRDPAWQAAFLDQDVASRADAARSLRAASRDAGTGKTRAIMDVTPSQVINRFTATDAPVMIHGHTHRPDTHELHVNGERRIRHVLGDWHDDGAQVVVADAAGVRRVPYPFRASTGGTPPPSRG